MKMNKKECDHVYGYIESQMIAKNFKLKIYKSYKHSELIEKKERIKECDLIFAYCPFCGKEF